MPDLIAQGKRRQNRWRRTLPVGELLTLGRSAGPWSVTWDEHISRRHAQVRWERSTLHVEVLPSAQNPLFFQGAAVQQCRLQPGEHFVIGGTTFTLTQEEANISVDVPPPVTEQTFSPEYLRRLRFRDPDHRIEILSRLPERIAAAGEDQKLHEEVVRVLLEGIPQADSAALVATDLGTAEPQVRLLHWDHLASEANESESSLNPSQRLIVEAVSRGESVVHVWGAATVDGVEFTVNDNIDWAFCTPVPGQACGGWALYASGSAAETPIQTSPSDMADLRDELKFAEVVGTTLSSFCEVRRLQRKQAALGQFFSPPVIAALGDGDPDQILAPREVDVTVLFCDLRGFSLEMERSADDLFGLLERVSDALGVLTKHILNEGGVVGDFHGDAAMGFWGWPLAQEDAAWRASRAALAIRHDFQAASKRADHSLANFRIGVGVASGRAVAGKIGTADQVKVTVFGPVVNLASRLENMTKQLNASVLLDATTAKQIRAAPSKGDARLRRLAVVRPYGLESVIEINELLPPEAEHPLLADEHIRHYEHALDLFSAGDWSAAWEKLHQVPAADASKGLSYDVHRLAKSYRAAQLGRCDSIGIKVRRQSVGRPDG